MRSGAPLVANMCDDRCGDDMDSGSDGCDSAVVSLALHVVLEVGSPGCYLLKHVVTGERVPVQGAAGSP